MMVHPWPTDRLDRHLPRRVHFDVTFTGKSAHASAAPWEGVNALDALTVAQVGDRPAAPAAASRATRYTESCDGGGDAANVIPASVTARYMCRASTLEDLARPRAPGPLVLRGGCARDAARRVDYTELSPVYSHMEPDAALLSAFRANAEALGRRYAADDDGVPAPTLSTDMANVSLAVPTIHPLMGIEAGGAVNHQPAFAEAAVSRSADLAVHDGSVAMAWTAIDAASAPMLRERLLSAAR